MDRVIVIAEAGVNHNGSVARAFRMVDAAAAAGADYIKFQTFKAERLVNRFAQQAEYQKRNLKANGTQTGGSSNGSGSCGDLCDDTQLSMLRSLELSQNDFIDLKRYCAARGIGFLSSPFDMESLDFLLDLGQDYLKIPSGEITNLPMLRRIAASGTPVIMSTGMCDIDEIGKALKILYANGLKPDDVTLLHCNTEYPTPMRDVNLRAMQTLGREFGVKVGYSDHTKGIEVPVAAVALDARVIEKHFTLDKSLPGPDHVASLDPVELTAMVSAIRNIEVALGDGVKRVTDSERKNRDVARKSIVAKRDISKGEILSEENLTVKRPGTGLSPMQWDEIIGTMAKRDYSEDELILE